MKASKYEEMVKERVEQNLEMKTLTLDNQKLKSEVEKVCCFQIAQNEDSLVVRS
jgi:hypothetical protein